MQFSKKKSVLQIITGLNYGGAEQVVFDIVRFGDKSKYNYYLISLSGEVDRIKDFESVGITPNVFKINKKNPFSFIDAIRNIKAFVKKNDIEIIHAHMFHAGLVSLFIKALIPKIKLAFTSHNVMLGSKFRNLIIRLSKDLRNTDIIFSELMKADFYTKHIEIIPNGIEIENKPKVEKNKIFTYISIAGLRPVKNHIHLVNCASKLIEKGIKDFEIWIVGKGETEQALKLAIQQNKLTKHIILKGFQKDVLTFAGKAHCFVMPSHWEGFPISILEAGLAELPVIATPVGSIPDMLADGCGYLAEPAEFADTMIEVKQNYQAAQTAGKKLRNKVIEQYDINKVVDQHEELYNKILNT